MTANTSNVTTTVSMDMTQSITKAAIITTYKCQ